MPLQNSESVKEINGVEYRVLAPQSFGQVASTVKETVLPRRYPKLRAGERCRYKGSGILPICRIEDQVYILTVQQNEGELSGLRLLDFGGDKNSPTERPASCACRHFAEQTYGVFSTDAQWEKDELLDNVKEMFSSADRTMMTKCAEDWAHKQLLDGEQIVSFYHDQLGYHTYLLSVPYITPDVLDACSEVVDGGQRWFRWLTPNEFLDQALTPRLHIESLFSTIRVLRRDAKIITPMEDLIPQPCQFDAEAHSVKSESSASSSDEEESPETSPNQESREEPGEEAQGGEGPAEEVEAAPVEEAKEEEARAE